MPKYRVKSSHIHSAGVAVDVGQIVELDKKEGEHRCGIGLLEPYVEPAKDEDDEKGKGKK